MPAVSVLFLLIARAEFRRIQRDPLAEYAQCILFAETDLFSRVSTRDASGQQPEVYCLPVFLYRLTGAPVPWLLLKLPVLAILAMSMLPLFLASRRRRIHVLIATFMLCLLSHFLCYYMVWEYHYTTLLPMLPVLWWMSQREDARGCDGCCGSRLWCCWPTSCPRSIF